MSVYRTTIFMGQATMGASETYWTTDVSATNGASNITNLLSMRAALLPNISYFQGARIAVEGPGRVSQLSLPGTDPFFDSGQTVTVPKTGAFTAFQPAGGPDMWRNTLNYRLFFAGGRKTTRYMSGIPDEMTTTEPGPFVTANNAAWAQAFGKFGAELTSGRWQLRAQDTTTATLQFPVIGLTLQQAAPGLVGVIIRTSGAPTIAIGNKIALHGMRAAKGTRGSTMNGTWMVDSLDTTNAQSQTTVFLRGSAGIDPAAQRFTDKTTLRQVVYQFYPITQLAWQTAGPRRRGKPSLAPRGRRLTIKSLDP